MPQEEETLAPGKRRRERRAPSERVLVKSLLGVLPTSVSVADVRSGAQELPVPESMLPKGWIPPPSMTEVFIGFIISPLFFFIILIFSSLSSSFS